MATVISINKDKNAHNRFGNYNNANIANVDKKINISTSNNTGAANINKEKNINNKYSNVAISKIGENIKKQLKVSKFKVFIVVINCKKSHLLKKILFTKLL